MSRLALAVFLLLPLCACPPWASSGADASAAVASAEPGDGGWHLTPAALDAWLRYQAALNAQSSPDRRDGGADAGRADGGTAGDAGRAATLADGADAGPGATLSDGGAAGASGDGGGTASGAAAGGGDATGRAAGSGDAGGAARAAPAGDAVHEEVRRRARLERDLRLKSGLSQDDLDHIEELVGAVVAQRTLARISGVEALRELQKAGAALKDEPRKQAERALADLDARAREAEQLSAERGRFGDENVNVLLGRIAEVERVWEQLLSGPQ